VFLLKHELVPYASPNIMGANHSNYNHVEKFEKGEQRRRTDYHLFLKLFINSTYNMFKKRSYFFIIYEISYLAVLHCCIKYIRGANGKTFLSHSQTSI
jgi:hypothetical protein